MRANSASASLGYLPEIIQRRFVPEWNVKTKAACRINDGFDGRFRDSAARERHELVVADFMRLLRLLLCLEKLRQRAWASQASDVGSLPIARSINPVDAVGFTGFLPQKSPLNSPILDAVGREISREIRVWTQRWHQRRGYCEQVVRLPDLSGPWRS